MLDRLSFLIGEGLAAFRRNGLMTLASVSTAAVALFVLGGMALAYLQVRDYADGLTGKFTMRAFLRDGTNRTQISETAAKIRELPGVAEVNWIPRDKAWAKERATHPDLTAGLENPFPDALKVRLDDLKKTDEVVAAISAMSTISPTERVQYLAEEQQKLAEATTFIRWVGLAVGGLCLLTAGVLIYNTIRLTVVARRRELRVMQLVGASFATIRIPFLIEGAMQGLFGGVLGALLLRSAHFGLAYALQPYASLGKPGDFPVMPALFAACAAGVAFGVLCSAAAVRDPLKLGASGA